MKRIIILIIVLLTTTKSYSQVGIGTNTPEGSAQLEVKSTTKGLLTPRMTASERAAINSPSTGLIVYQTDGTQGFYYNAGTPQSPSWVILLNGGSSLASSNISGTISVANGGTGLNAITPYAPVFGGTTTSSPLQSASSLGTSGQVLTSNGSSQLPSFQSIPSSPQQLPIGTTIPFAGATLPESSGYLICDGSAVSRSIYANLFLVIGTNYGSGDGSTTFNLPDLRGRSVIGAGQGNGLSNRNLGTTGGAETHTLSIAEMPNHNHTISDPGHNHNYNTFYAQGNGQGNMASNILSGINTYTVNTSQAVTGIYINPTGANQAHNNMSPFISLNYIIKY
jgi:microcystin-dependent protein